MGLLGVLLAALGVYQEVTLRRELMVTRVAALNSDLVAARTSLARGPKRNNIPVDIAVTRELCKPSAVQNRSLIQSLANAVTATSGRTVTVVLYDSAGAVASAAPGPQSAPRLAENDVRQALGGKESQTRELTGPSGDEVVAGLPLTAGRATCGVAQLSTSMQPIDDAVAGQRRQLVLGDLGGLALALVIGVLLTGGALRPLRRLTGTAGRLASGDLAARADVGPRRDEVGVLAHAFDDMAERIQRSFTAQAESMAALLASEDRTRRFVADASHELRTPVTALKGYIEVMQRGAVRDAASFDAALDAMAREAERMRRLVLDLLALARLDATTTVVLERVDLGALITSVLDDDLPSMPGDMARDFEPSVIVMADPEAVVTIVRNLLSNATKYAPDAPQRWTVDRDGGYGRFQVHDDGPGISEADLPHVFERFYRGEKTRTREEGGSGLGMSIVQSLVHGQQGRITIVSPPAAGTTVTVALPVAPEPSITA